MSSSGSNPNLPSVKFPEIFEAALEEYFKRTEKNIKSDPLLAKFQDCNSSDAVIKALEDEALASEKYQQGDRKVQLMRRLKPIVRSLCRLSTKDDSIFPPTKAIFTGIGLMLEVRTVTFPSRLCLLS